MSVYTDRIKAMLADGGGVVTAAEVRSAKISPSYLALMVQDGTLNRLERGLYAASDAYVDEMFELYAKKQIPCFFTFNRIVSARVCRPNTAEAIHHCPAHQKCQQTAQNWYGGIVMKSAMQLKAIIKNIANEKGIAAQALLQNYMLERLLERISVSRYHDNFILKGGMLIAAIVGLDSRSTMDMDTTLRAMPLTEKCECGSQHQWTCSCSLKTGSPVPINAEVRPS